MYMVVIRAKSSVWLGGDIAAMARMVRNANLLKAAKLVHPKDAIPDIKKSGVVSASHVQNVKPPMCEKPRESCTRDWRNTRGQ